MRIVLLVICLALPVGAQSPNRNLERETGEALKRRDEHWKKIDYKQPPPPKLDTPVLKYDVNAKFRTVPGMPAQPAGESAGSPARVVPATERSALQKAAAAGEYEQVRALVEGGADPRQPDGAGDTPLHLAAGRGDWKTVDYLLGVGADGTAANAKGETPLHLAARVGALEVGELLLKAGASPSVKDKAGRTPLELARKCTQGSARQLEDTLRKASGN